MSSNTMIETSADLNDESKTPAKINAFQFMMNSRHKVIGTNSPGKDKKDIDMKSPEITEKAKEKLSKRKAVFEDWAEKKGGTKRKLMNEAAEKHINKTLQKRAKRLKKMLDIIEDELKNSGEEGSDMEEIFVKVKVKKHRKPLLIDSDNSSNPDDINKTQFEKPSKENCDNEEKEISTKNDSENVKTNTKKLDETKMRPTKKTKINCSIEMEHVNNTEITKEEIEKNSTIVNEKENISNNSDNDDKDNNKQQLKSPKNSKLKNSNKNRKNSLTLKKSKEVDCNITVTQIKKAESPKNNAFSDLSDEDIFPVKKFEVKSVDTTTRKPGHMKLIIDSNTKQNEDIKNENFSHRSWRMKVKLIENTNNDDNELNDLKDREILKSDENSKDENDSDKEVEENVIVIEESQKKQGASKEISNSSRSTCGNKTEVKLAPIFLRQQQKQVEKDTLNARKNFLHSGVPAKVKKLMTKPKSFHDPDYTFRLFPKISHVQQRGADDSLNIFWELPKTNISFPERESSTKLLFAKINIGSFTNCKSIDVNLNRGSDYAPPSGYNNLKQIIKEIKKANPSFPVYKIFRILYQKYEKYANTTDKSEIKIEETPKTETPKPKRGRPKKKKETLPTKSVNVESPKSELGILMWTEKYRPQSQEDVIGNTTSVQELKSWLESWIRYSEDHKSSRKRRHSNSSDDFCSDSTTKDSESLPQNLILLFGPLGSGKTSSVYGLCNELSINVIEINASSKRSGKKILSDLQEATQSHQVKNTDSKSVNSFFQKKSDSQTEDDINKKLSLLLFEDVDIVFEDDDNFIPAVTTLATSSKRPIILTFSEKKCPYLQKFILQYTVINFNSLSSRILSPWLQILCLVEGVRTDKDMIERMVQWNKGDVRKTILQLQFWAQTGGDSKIHKFDNSCPEISSNAEISLMDEDIFVDDESSELSWMNMENSSATQENNSNFRHQNCTESFIPYYERDKDGFKLSYPVNLEVLWWNTPAILGENNNNFVKNQNISNGYDQKNINEIKTEEKNENTKVKTDEFNSTVKFLESLAYADVVHTKLKLECYDEPIYNYWQINSVNSLSFNENFTMYNENNTTSLEITHWIVENTAKHCQKLQENENITLNVNTTVPYVEELSWRSKRHKNMKELMSAVPAISILDRRAICEDYHMILRSICRTENERSAMNSKRKNRFYHYFKNFNIHLNDSSYLLLCNTLATKC